MAFALANLIPIGGQSSRSKGPQVWSYKSQDAVATQDTANYFLGAYDRLSAGDFIISVVVNGSDVPTGLGFLVVQSSSSTTVDTFNVVTSTTLTDSD